MKTSLPKTIEAFAQLAEKKYENINDELMKDWWSNPDFYAPITFSFDIDKTITIEVSGYSRTNKGAGHIELRKLEGRGNQPKKLVQSFTNINSADFLDMVEIPLIEFNEVSRGEYMFKYDEHSLLLTEKNVGREGKGLSVFLCVLEDGFKRTELKEIGWLLTDGNDGFMRSSAIKTDCTVNYTAIQSLALGYVYKFLKLNK